METAHLKGKSILITGGTGTFGNAMVKRLTAIPEIRKIIIFSRDEYKQSQMARVFPDPRLRFLLGDIRDKERLLRAFADADIVIHAAALKQVPALEYNPSEAVETNVIGTRNVINAALDMGVEKILFISSDKAVQPINLYGATKLCAERIAIASNAYSGTKKTRISVIRYGNVLGSRGSLLELIEKERATGMPIPLTDERMTRFWIKIERVAEAVIEALSLIESGEIFIPKMKSARVKDLIQTLAPDSSIIVTGMRPGEKIHEMLITEYEAKRTKDSGNLYIIEPEFAPWGRDNPFAAFPAFPYGAYASNSKECLVPSNEAHAVLV